MAIDEIVAEYSRLRADKGVIEGDKEWAQSLLPAWLEAVGSSTNAIDDDVLIRLGISMGISIAFRDAVVLSVTGNVTLDQLVEVASNPLSEEAHHAMVENFSGVLHSPAFRPQVSRCRTVLGLLSRMVSLLAQERAAQPLTVIGYVHWWLGDLSEAEKNVRQALETDKMCVFAVILLHTIENHVLPAWEHEGDGGTGKDVQI